MTDRIIRAAETVMELSCLGIAVMLLIDGEPVRAAAFVAVALASRLLRTRRQRRTDR